MAQLFMRKKIPTSQSLRYSAVYKTEVIFMPYMCYVLLSECMPREIIYPQMVNFRFSIKVHKKRGNKYWAPGL